MLRKGEKRGQCKSANDVQVGQNPTGEKKQRISYSLTIRGKFDAQKPRGAFDLRCKCYGG